MSPRQTTTLVRLELNWRGDDEAYAYLVATMNPATMETLSLFRGDTVIIRGKKRRDTVLICLSSDDVEEGRIQMNKVARNNLRVKLADLVNVHPCLDIKYGKRVHILPFDDSIEGLSGNIFEVYLKPYFLEGVYPPPIPHSIISFPSSIPPRPQGRHFPGPWWHANSRIQGCRHRPCRVLYCRPGHSHSLWCVFTCLFTARTHISQRVIP